MLDKNDDHDCTAFGHLAKLDECIGVLDGNDHQDPFADQGECRAVTFQVSERVLARRGRVRASARVRARARARARVRVPRA